MPDIRLVAETPETELQRQHAARELADAWRQLAGNIMRVVRGAGRPEDLYGQMRQVAAASDAVHAAVGALPSSAEIADFLRLQNPTSREGCHETDLDEYQICRAALQVCASELARQEMHRGFASTKLREVVRAIGDARAERLRKKKRKR